MEVKKKILLKAWDASEDMSQLEASIYPDAGVGVAEVIYCG